MYITKATYYGKKNIIDITNQIQNFLQKKIYILNFPIILAELNIFDILESYISIIYNDGCENIIPVDNIFNFNNRTTFNEDVIECTYGTNNNYVNVTNLCKKFFLNDQLVQINNKNFSDPLYGIVKKMIVVYSDNVQYIIPENNYFRFLSKNMEIINYQDKFLSDLVVENLVIITSKIFVSSLRFLYVANRSIYSHEERYKQTIDTINSIKKYMPNPYIIIIDDSNFTDHPEIKNNLANMVDMFVNPVDNMLHYYTDICLHKQLAETAQLVYLTNMINFKFRNLFKITGRYLINENFNYDAYYNNNNDIFRKCAERYYFTCFYKIHFTNFDKYKRAMDAILKNANSNINYANEALETTLPKELKYAFVEAPILGITQNISIWKNTDKI